MVFQLACARLLAATAAHRAAADVDALGASSGSEPRGHAAHASAWVHARLLANAPISCSQAAAPVVDAALAQQAAAVEQLAAGVQAALRGGGDAAGASSSSLGAGLAASAAVARSRALLRKAQALQLTPPEGGLASLAPSAAPTSEYLLATEYGLGRRRPGALDPRTTSQHQLCSRLAACQQLRAHAAAMQLCATPQRTEAFAECRMDDCAVTCAVL